MLTFSLGRNEVKEVILIVTALQFTPGSISFVLDLLKCSVVLKLLLVGIL